MRIRQSVRAGNNVSTLAVSGSGKYCMCNNKNVVEFYEVYKYELIGNKESGVYPANQLVYAAEERYGVLAERALTLVDVDYTAANSSDVVKSSTDYFINSENHFGPVYSLTVSGGYALSCSEGDDNLKLWKVSKTGVQLLQTESLRYTSLFQPPQMNLTATAISPNGLHVVTSGSKPFDLIMFSLNNSKL